MTNQQVQSYRHLVALAAVTAERERQEQCKRDGRFKYSCADDGMMLTDKCTVLVEEVGEVAREVLTSDGRRLAHDTEGTNKALYRELVQVAAVAVAWMESLLVQDPTRQDAWCVIGTT